MLIERSNLIPTLAQLQLRKGGVKEVLLNLV